MTIYTDTPLLTLLVITFSSTSMNWSSLHSLSPMILSQEQQEMLIPCSTAEITPHLVQSSVLSMCQAIIPTESSSFSREENNDWLSKLLDQPQSVIITPRLPQTQTSPNSSRRTVRIQIINKHDDISLLSSTMLPMIPSPVSSSSIVLNESSSSFVDSVTSSNTSFHTFDNQHELVPLINETTGMFLFCLIYLLNKSHVFFESVAYEILHGTSNNDIMDFDHSYDNGGWIDTPVSHYETNSTDIISTSPYSSFDFLSL